MNTTFLHNGVTAHRGNSAEFPENTLSAIRSALALGADWIEIDVLATRDGVLVLSHDTDTGRTGDRRVEIQATNYAELRDVDVASGLRRSGIPAAPARIPRLSEVFQLLRGQSRTRLSIQPKGSDLSDAIFALIAEHDMAGLVGFNDASIELMQRVKACDARIPIFWDRHDYADESRLDADVEFARENKFQAMVLRHDTLTHGRAEKIRRAGLEAGAWTVNDPASMERLADMGVERFYTDCPARALDVLAGRV